MKITVEIKNNFGSQAIYPVCDKAITFAKIAGTRTLTSNTLSLIKQLGYQVEVKQQTL